MDRIISPTVRRYSAVQPGQDLELVVSKGCRVRIKVIALDPTLGAQANVAFSANDLATDQSWPLLSTDPPILGGGAQPASLELDLWFGSKSSVFIRNVLSPVDIVVLTEQGGFGYGEY